MAIQPGLVSFFEATSGDLGLVSRCGHLHTTVLPLELYSSYTPLLLKYFGLLEEEYLLIPFHIVWLNFSVHTVQESLSREC